MIQIDQEAMDALDASIDKWRKVVAGEVEGGGRKNCPLCAIYHPPGYTVKCECDGCPIYAKTRTVHCENSPYEDWAHVSGYSERAMAETPEQISAAMKMLQFLMDLRAECEVKKEKTLQEKLNLLYLTTTNSADVSFIESHGELSVSVKMRSIEDWNWCAVDLRELSSHLLKVADVLEEHKCKS